MRMFCHGKCLLVNPNEALSQISGNFHAFLAHRAALKLVKGRFLQRMLDKCNALQLLSVIV